MLDWLKSKFRYSKTVLAARVFTVAGIAVSAHDIILPYAMGQDWTPITKDLPPLVIPVGLVAQGLLFEYLRTVTSQPLIDKIPPGPDGDTMKVGKDASVS